MKKQNYTLPRDFVPVIASGLNSLPHVLLWSVPSVRQVFDDLTTPSKVVLLDSHCLLTFLIFLIFCLSSFHSLPSQNWLISSTSEMPFKVNVIHNEVELTLKSYEILHFTPLKLLFLYDIIWCNFVFIYYCLFASLECKLSEVRLSLLLIPRAYNSVCTEYMFSSGWASQVLQQSININPQLTSPQSNNIL